MRSLLEHAAASACALIVATGVSAQSPGDPLTLRESIDRALAHRPELAAFAFELRAQEAQYAEARLRPPLQAELLVEDAAGTGDRSGFSSAQTTLSLSRLIELGGKREARASVAGAAMESVGNERAARQLDVVAEVARRYIDVLEGQARIDIAKQGVEVAERGLTAVGQRAQAGRSPPAESSRARAELINARLELEDAEHELLSERELLAAAMGERQASFGPARGELAQFAAPIPFETLLTRLERTPDILRFAAHARLRDAEVRLAQARRRADLRATLGVRRFEDGGDVALVAGITVPLQTAERAEPQIRAARAARERVESEQEGAFVRLRAQLFAQYQELQHARHAATMLREELMPSLETALQQTEHAYRRGRYSYLEWINAQRELVAARRRLIGAYADFQLHRTEIERLTGESLEPAGENP